MNIKISVAYDGTKYNGWQKQGNTPDTIAAKFETLLARMFSCPIVIHAAGRTDAGVHARAQICNFIADDAAVQTFLDGRHSPAKTGAEIVSEIAKTMNAYLPADIRVTGAEQVQPRFHARLLAKGKHYRYTVDNAKVADVFARKYAFRVEKPLASAQMQKAASFFVGTHDFAAFCTKAGKKKSTVRTITRLDITQDNGKICFDFFGDGFLYNMVRIIVGTLIEVGEGKRDAGDIPRVIASKRRAEAGFLAAAHGLCLEEVFY